ncbi:MAG: hypothetical protein LLF98_02715 [Clostridium sp.]|uniref:hypothetical protein n=1 Tax=Clostridium sp. TaxID=1506 RepID=UPI0025C5E476|nr:hypothetical protein [Clostridium sp.]MCE5220196.1 hypothetical protein [Clostridium sp.]
MQKVIHICDKCGVEKIYDQNSNSEFRKVKFLVGKRGSTYVSNEEYSNGVATSTEVFLCKECQIKLGIHGLNDKEEASFYKQPELIDRVFELFIDIADELGYTRSE